MKKKMVMLVGAVVLVAAVATVAVAQRGGRGWGRGPMALLSQLDLSAEQQQQLAAMQEQMRTALAAARESGERPDPETLRTLSESHQQQLAAILTPEQLARLEAMRAGNGGPMWDGEGAGWMPWGRPGGGFAGPGWNGAGNSWMHRGRRGKGGGRQWDVGRSSGADDA